MGGIGWFLGSVFAGVMSASISNLLANYENDFSKREWMCMNSLPIITVALVVGRLVVTI